MPISGVNKNLEQESGKLKEYKAKAKRIIFINEYFCITCHKINSRMKKKEKKMKPEPAGGCVALTKLFSPTLHIEPEQQRKESKETVNEDLYCSLVGDRRTTRWLDVVLFDEF